MGTESGVGTARKIAFETSLTETSPKDREGVGTIREDQVGQKYRWVKNSSDDAAHVGAPACFDGSAVGATFLQNVVTEDLATEDEWFLAGIFISAIPGGEYGWVMAWGKYDTARLDMTAASAGDICIASVETSTSTTSVDARGFVFMPNVVVAGIYGTGAGTAYECNWAANPHVQLLETVATTDTTTTTPASASVFVKALV